MTVNVDNYNKHDVLINTGNILIPFESQNINVNINNNVNNNVNWNNIQNNYTFKDFISSIIKIHTMTPRAIRIQMIVLTIFFSIPQLFFDWLNININTNINTLPTTYLLVAIIQKQTFSFIFCYFIVTEELNKIYQFPNGNKYFTTLCKIDTYWCEYYSILGIILVSYYYFINRYIDKTNIYILFISILKIAIVKYVLKNKKN
jgi:hypothetical protein